MKKEDAIDLLEKLDEMDVYLHELIDFIKRDIPASEERTLILRKVVSLMFFSYEELREIPYRAFPDLRPEEPLRSPEEEERIKEMGKRAAKAVREELARESRKINSNGDKTREC